MCLSRGFSTRNLSGFKNCGVYAADFDFDECARLSDRSCLEGKFSASAVSLSWEHTDNIAELDVRLYNDRLTDACKEAQEAANSGYSLSYKFYDAYFEMKCDMGMLQSLCTS
jgi:hypothetical protein